MTNDKSPRMKIEARGTLLSRQNSLSHFPEIIRKPVILAAVSIRQPRVIKSEQLQNRRVQVMNLDLILNGLRAKRSRDPVFRAAFYAPPRKPHAERLVVVIAAGIVVAVAIACH